MLTVNKKQAYHLPATVLLYIFRIKSAVKNINGITDTYRRTTDRVKGNGIHPFI